MAQTESAACRRQPCTALPHSSNVHEIEKGGGEIGFEVLGARAHDACDVELQPKESLRFVQQLLHPPPLLERPNSNRRFEQEARMELLAEAVLQRGGQDVGDG